MALVTRRIPFAAPSIVRSTTLGPCYETFGALSLTRMIDRMDPQIPILLKCYSNRLETIIGYLCLQNLDVADIQ